jgi:tetratricopeptide (TPR) repeat protein
VLRERSQREIARRTLERAKERQAQSQFGAALSEYRAARALDPSLDGVDVAIEHMQKELAAAALIDEARMDIRCDRFDQARKRLASAFELSILARADIAELIQMTARREGERAYQLARDLEIQGKKAEALAAYESLGKDWPNGLLDELVRIEGLRGDIANATSEWTAAEAAEAGGDVAAAIEHYAASERYYPGWKDGKARIERLRAKLPAPAEGEGAPREGAAR